MSIFGLVLILLSCCLSPLSGDGGDSVWFREQKVVGAGDEGCYWRIPALLSLRDGTLLMACDRRKNNEADLPEDIDAVLIRSSDGGQTWGKTMTIAEGKGKGRGYGDVALVECANDDVVCTFAGGNGFWLSTEKEPISTYICISKDGGNTWSSPQDVTNVIWGSKSENPDGHQYKGSFNASGNGLRLKSGKYEGRIMFVAALCRKSEWAADNYVLYSDDNGTSWKISQQAYRGGDEAKVVELPDGRILMSVRQTGERGYAVSSDGGETWEHQGRWTDMRTNACNGDLMIVELDKGEKVLLQALPNSMERENVSLFVSRDNGITWPEVVKIVDGPSVYSSMTQLTDGTIGMMVEKVVDGHFELWYLNFTKAWLTEKLRKESNRNDNKLKNTNPTKKNE